MESHSNLPPPPPPPPFNPWDPLPPPPLPPPPPPPPHFQWGNPNPGYSGDIYPQFPPFPSPPHHSFPPSAAAQPHFPSKRKLERADDCNLVKLYVGGVPRNVTQEEIYHLFEEHGNVIEVVFLPDRWSGQNQEYCFVKYASIEEASRAITALHNQFTFPGAMVPIKVKYADAAKRPIGFEPVSKVQHQGLNRSVPHEQCIPRTGLMKNDSFYPGQASVGETLHKLYVNFHNREASKQDIEEIFSSYGDVADVYLMRDESKKNRGCGFVGFTQRHMAVAAINGLHGSYVMKGCDKPLVVRFAEPKKPKNRQFRPVNSVDMWGSNAPNDLHLANSSDSIQVNSTDLQAGCFPEIANRLETLEYPVSSEMQKHPHQRFSPSHFSQMSLQHSQLQHSQPSQGSPQSSRQTDSPSQTPFHSNQTSISIPEEQHGCQSLQPSGDTGSHSVIPTAEIASCNLSSDLVEDPVDCDWSEHICPDGKKYYFNSATSESRWEKPEEFVLYEQQLRSKQFQNHSCQDPLPSSLEASSNEEDSQGQVAQDQSKSCDTEKPQLAISCAVEHSNEQVQAETTAPGGPACVQ